MKKSLSILSVLLLLLATVGCGTQAATHDKLNIATTAYALKYFIEKVGGSEVNVTFSFTSNPHHLELTQRDAQAVTDSDALFNIAAGDYINAEEQLRNLNKEMKYFDVTKNISLLPSSETHEHDESAEHAEHVASHSHDTMEMHGDTTTGQKKQSDPHIWLDPKRASVLVTNITDGLSELKPDKSEYFKQNAAALEQKLTALDETFHNALAVVNKPYILVNHAAYGYLANRYHLEQKAVNDISDHSENTQASIIALDNFIGQHDIRHVFIEPNTETNSVIDTLTAKYQLEQITLFNLETPVNESADDYFLLMQQNAQNIKKAVV